MGYKTTAYRAKILANRDRLDREAEAHAARRRDLIAKLFANVVEAAHASSVIVVRREGETVVVLNGRRRLIISADFLGRYSVLPRGGNKPETGSEYHLNSGSLDEVLGAVTIFMAIAPR